MTNEELDRLIEAIDDRTKGTTNQELLSSMGVNSSEFIEGFLLPKVHEAALMLEIKGKQHVLLPFILADLVMNGILLGAELQKLKEEGTWLNTF